MKKKLLKVSILLLPTFFLGFFLLKPIFAQSSIESDNYTITWPNLNSGAGIPSSDGYKVNTTIGQTAPGLYTSTGYKVKAGFQYIHSIIPFSFTLSSISLPFGSLNIGSFNDQNLTLTVNSGSAGGYQVKAAEDDPLTSTTLTIISDTTCDSGDTCSHTDSGTWAQSTTYGFGYTISGDDVPSDFDSSKYKNFADLPGETAQKIMGKTPGEGHQATEDKTATLTARINLSNTQAAGTYENVLIFTAIPIF